MEIEYLNELPDVEFVGQRNKVVEQIKKWEKTESKVLKLISKNVNEKHNTYTSVRKYIRDHNVDYTIHNEKHSYNIYLVRS